MRHLWNKCSCGNIKGKYSAQCRSCMYASRRQKYAKTRGWVGPLKNAALGHVAATHHGHNRRKRRTRTYMSWDHMIQRCCNPRNDNFHRYGGRGINVCNRWLGPDGFLHFLADMGDRPKNKSLERNNKLGNYEPLNCRWATRKQQQNNMRANRVFKEALANWGQVTVTAHRTVIL